MALGSMLVGQAEPIVLDRGLAIPRVTVAGRNAAPTDLIADLLVRNRLGTPLAGEKLASDRGEAEWREVSAGEQGFDQRAFQSGYLLCTVELPSEGTYLLRASGHGMVYVNGEPRGGDVYGYGYLNLPVALRKGRNTFLFSAGRGQLAAKLVPAPAGLWLDVSDPTVPDLLTSEAGSSVWAAVVVQNTGASAVRDAVLECALGGRTLRTRLLAIPPIAARKVPFRVPVPKDAKPGAVQARLTLRWDGRKSEAQSLPLQVVLPKQVHRRTFFSSVDGSLQYYAVTPSQKPGPDNALVLSVHGASVEAISQARAYRPKDWLTLVAATNRRPYGFDWEDWGRMDALEVLGIAKWAYPHDPSRVILTGHSMGGHGTWHIGLTHPDLFAAIGPAAGWISFRTYAGLVDPGKPEDPVASLLQRAGTPSDTLGLVRNALHYGVYILHGDADESVPVMEARRMREVLSAFHPDLHYYEKPGGSHWWGDDSVDWPEMFAFFQNKRIPDPAKVRRVEFVTANPAVSSRSNWVEVLQQERCLKFSSVVFERVGDRIEGTTSNVAALAFDVGRMDERPSSVAIDGQTLRLAAKGARAFLLKSGGVWRVTGQPARWEKGPHRGGPLKLAFQRHMAFVFGTSGTRDENAWSFAKARYDAEQWQYRGNGAVDLIPDTEATAERLKGRNVILYGNERTNVAIRRFVDPKCPIRVDRGALAVGDRAWRGGGYSVLFAYPKAGEDEGMAVVVGGTDVVGMRQTDRLPYLAPGIAYPDWTVFGPGYWREGVSAILATGFFANDWRLDPSQSAWR